LDERLAAVVEEYAPDSAEGQRTVIRHGLTRRLLDDPVIYLDELDPPSHDYFLNQRGAMAARLCEACDLKAEQRAEGTALVDTNGELTDEALPAEGTLHHITLLVAQYLAGRAQSGLETGVPESEIAAYVCEASDEYGRYWRKSAREPGAETELAREAIARLAALKLVRRRDKAVWPRPALLRFAVGVPQFVSSLRLFS
jgi:uncharacterized protein (TIGR02678 family)